MGYRVEKDVMVPMRDGVMLATDLFVPNNGPSPALLIRMGYDKNLMEKTSYHLLGSTLGFVEAGYAVVWQDCRGAYGSEGAYVPHVDDAADGAETVAWIRAQPWCDGNIGSFGTSYMGWVQWATASAQPEGLKAIAPTSSTTDYYRAPWYSDGGARSWHMMFAWAQSQVANFEDHALRSGTGGDPDLREQGMAVLADAEPHLTKLPMIDHPTLSKAPWWRQWMDHPDRDQFWSEMAPSEHLREITIPALQITGWFDYFVSETARTFTRMRAEAGTAEAREGQRLLIGPWDHLQAEALYSDREFGPAAHHVTEDLMGHHLRFYDRYLRGNASALEGTTPVRIFVMGVDEWRDEQDWPLPDTEYVDYYLDGSGRANTDRGDGVLAPAKAAAEATDTFRYDPSNPVPSVGGRFAPGGAADHVLRGGPVDQCPVEARDDALCFTTPPLRESLEVTGPVCLVLHASSSARDTDFTGKLVDVFPDGRAIYLTDGILRARYRNSLAEPALLDPEQVYELRIDLGPTSNVFLPGHRIRLEVSSSNFPRYDRNTNTGNVIAYDTATDVVVALNRVTHGPAHPSRLVLPVIRR